MDTNLNMEHYAAISYAIGICAIIVAVIIKFLKDLREEEGVARSITFAPPGRDTVELVKPGSAYERWRAELREWVEKGGGQEGLQALLDRWDGVPHEKPKAPPPFVVLKSRMAGLTTLAKKWEEKFGGAEKAQLPPFDKFDYVYKAPEQIAEMLGGGESAAARFIERNRKEVQRRLFGATPPFKVGQWVRFTAKDNCWPGRLALVKSVDRQYVSVRLSENESDNAKVDACWLEPTLPRAGEWWRIVKACTANLAGRSENLNPFKVDQNWGNCTCVVEPVNFGRGEEAKS